MDIYTGLKVIGLLCLLTGCASNGQHNIKHGAQPFIEGTSTIEILREIPDLDNQPQITIAVYNFTDQTGQRKPNPNFSQLSTAVTQGPDVWVISALKAVGNGDWFKVVERRGLDNLIKERQLIRSTRETIASYSFGGDVFRFLDMGTKALEFESGNTTNEPVNYAIRTTIEHAVLQMVYAGVNKGLWKMKGVSKIGNMSNGNT